MKTFDSRNFLAAGAVLLIVAGPATAAAPQQPGSSVTVTASAQSTDEKTREREERTRDAEQDAREREEHARQAEQDAREREQDQREQERDRVEQQNERQRERAEDERDRAQQKIESESDTYDAGVDLIDEQQYSEAIRAFRDVARMRMAHADGALYWKAYAENKSGLRADALSTLDELNKGFPTSRWKADAKALEVEIRQSSGQKVSPDRVSGGDEDLKLMAINSLMASDPERAFPLLEGLVRGTSSNKVKDRALFVLSQSPDPRAKHIIGEIARGNANPEMQRSALKYLGIVGGEEARKELAAVYAASADADVKRSVLKSFMISGDKQRILELARHEKSPDLRGDAVRQLGLLGAKDEIADLYKSETSIEVKKQIIQAMFLSGGNDRLAELARAEKTPELRITAIRNLGLMGMKNSEELTAIYASDTNPQVRKAVAEALFLAGDGKGLIRLARAEKDPAMKRELVQKLSLMGTKEASDYMLELLRD